MCFPEQPFLQPQVPKLLLGLDRVSEDLSPALQGAVAAEAEAQLELVGAGRWMSLQHFSCLDPGSSQSFQAGTH